MPAGFVSRAPRVTYLRLLFSPEITYQNSLFRDNLLQLAGQQEDQRCLPVDGYFIACVRCQLIGIDPGRRQVLRERRQHLVLAALVWPSGKQPWPGLVVLSLSAGPV